MELSKLFSTEGRGSILAAVLFKMGEVTVVDVARELRLGKSYVSRYLTILKKERILIRKRSGYFVAGSFEVRLLKILLGLKALAGFDFKKYSFVMGAGVYGSAAKGENDEESDIDIWIAVSEWVELKNAKLAAALRKKTGKVSLLFVTEEKLRIMKKADPLFFRSLAFGSLRLYGEDIVGLPGMLEEGFDQEDRSFPG